MKKILKREREKRKFCGKMTNPGMLGSFSHGLDLFWSFSADNFNDFITVKKLWNEKARLQKAYDFESFFDRLSFKFLKLQNKLKKSIFHSILFFRFYLEIIFKDFSFHYTLRKFQIYLAPPFLYSFKWVNTQTGINIQPTAITSPWASFS